jgi:hypothetical protein
MCHPSVFIRKTVFETFGLYDEDDSKKYNQDYDLWTKLIHKTKFHNLMEELLYLRTQGNKISTVHFNAQTDSTISINRSHLSSYLEMEIPGKIIRGLWYWKYATISDAELMIKTIIKTFNKYIEKENLTKKEINLICRDTSRRILLIAITKLYSPLMMKYFFISLKYDKLGIFRTLWWGLKAIVNKYIK